MEHQDEAIQARLDQERAIQAHLDQDEWSNGPSDKASAVNRDRMTNYGDPTPNMELLAALWNGFLLDHLYKPLSAEDVSEMMVLLKIMREKQSGYRREYDDNRVDACGWTNVLHQVIESHATEEARHGG